MVKKTRKLHKDRLLTSNPHQFSGGGAIPWQQIAQDAAGSASIMMDQTAQGLSNIANMYHNKWIQKQNEQMADYKDTVAGRTQAAQTGLNIQQAKNEQLQQSEQMKADAEAKQNAMFQGTQPRMFEFGGSTFGGIDMSLGTGFGSTNMFQMQSPTYRQAPQLRAPKIDIPVTQQDWSNSIYAQQQLSNIPQLKTAKINSFSDLKNVADSNFGAVNMKPADTQAPSDNNTQTSPGASAGMGSMLLGSTLKLDNALGQIVGGDYHTGVGDVVSKLPGLGLVGGLANSLFGIKTNQTELNRVKGDNTYLSNVAGQAATATSFDDQSLNGPMAVNFNVKAYKGGLFSKGKAGRKNRELADELKGNYDFAQRASTNSISNLADTQSDNLMATFAAYGGPLEYGMQKPYLNNMYMDARGSKTTSLPNSFVTTPNQGLYSFGFGGDLMTQGGDWSNGLIWVNEGGSHEANPQQGVPMGVAPDGQPNLVEEGEVVFEDYVLSNRLRVPKELRERFKLDKGATFADAAKKASRESEERPNDPISKRGLFDSMKTLIASQEEVRQIKRAKETQKAINEMPPEQFAQMQQVPFGQQSIPQQELPQEQLSQEEMAAQELTQQGNGEYAYGGHLHAYGDNIVRKADGTIDFDKSTFGLKEVTVTAPKKSSTDPLLAPMLIHSTSVSDLSLPQQQLLIQGAVTKQDMARRKRDYLLGKSADWFACRGRKFAGGGPAGQYYEEEEPIVEDEFPLKNHTSASTLSVSPKLAGINPDLMEPAPVVTTKVKGINPDIVDQTGPIVTDVKGTKDKVIGSDVITKTLTSAVTGPTKKEVKAAKKTSKKQTTTDGDNHENGTDVLPTWMRYVPVFGSALGIGLSYLPTDYSNAERLEKAAAQAGDYDKVSFNPGGNYLTYRPEDINYIANQLRASEEATARNILNTSGGNRGTAMAGLLANAYNSQLALGDAYRDAFLANREQEQKVEDFNRETNKTNSLGFLEAAKANQSARAQAQGQYLSAIETAAKMRQLIDDSRDQSRAANLSSLFNNIGNIGRENMAFNMVNSNKSQYYGINTNGTIYYKPAAYDSNGNLKQEAIDELSNAATNGKSDKKAYGGMLTKRGRKGGRR